MRTVVALFDDRSVAEQARQDLIRNGFPSQDVMLENQPPRGPAASQEEPGFWDKIKEFFGGEEESTYAEAARRGGTILAVSTPDDHRTDIAADLLSRHNPINIDERAEAWRQSGWKGVRQTAAPKTAVPPVQQKAGEEQRIPVVEEQMKVGKRQVQRGVRIYSRVTEKPVEEQVQLRDERVTVERQRTTRPVQGEPFKEKVVEVTETREEPVVSKEAHVVEEVVVRKEVAEHTETVRDTLRRTDVQVEDLNRDFRQDFDTNYAQRGVAFEDYQPAYQYGCDLARDPRYRGKEWQAIEPEARKSFENRQPGTWDRYRDAIHRAYDRTRSKITS